MIERIPYSRKKQTVIFVLFIISVAAILASALTFGIIAIVRANTVGEVRFRTHAVETEYGRAPDISDFTFEKVYLSGKTEIAAVTADMLSFDSESIGEQTAVISYKDFGCEFTLTINAKPLVPPAVRFDDADGKLKWDAVPGAGKYELSIGDFSKTLFATEYSLLDYAQVGALAVTVCAQPADGDMRYTAASSAPVTVTKLDGIRNLAYDMSSSALVWDEVEGAMGYYVTAGDNTRLERLNRCELAFTSGETTVSVYAAGGSMCLAGAPSTLRLVKNAPVTDIRYDRGTLSWTAAESGRVYEVTVNGETSATATTSIAVSFALSGVNHVSVVAEGGGAMPSDEATADFTLVKLAPPALRLGVDSVVWAEQEHTSCYTVTVNGTSADVDAPGFSTAELSGGEYTVTVTANADGGVYVDSDESQPLVFSKLAAVTGIDVSAVLDVSAGRYAYLISWEEVVGASGYEVTVNGGNVIRSTLPELQYNGQLAGGTNTVRVRALSNAPSTLAGNYCSHTVDKLYTPGSVYYADGTLSWKDSNVGATYVVTVNGEVTETAERSISVTLVGASSRISVVAKSSDGKVLDSDPAGGDFYSYTLEMPSSLQLLVLNAAGDMCACWNEAENADSYSIRVYIYKDGEAEPVTRPGFIGEGKRPGEVRTQSFSVPKDAVRVRVEVVAKDSTCAYNDSLAASAELVRNVNGVWE